MPDTSKDKKKGNGKGKNNKDQHRAKAKTGEADFADEDQDEVDENAGVNEEDAEACEDVAEFSDSEDLQFWVCRRLGCK